MVVPSFVPLCFVEVGEVTFEFCGRDKNFITLIRHDTFAVDVVDQLVYHQMSFGVTAQISEFRQALKVFHIAMNVT